MARKEYTKGDVINIFGKVIAKGLDLSGGAFLLLSKGIAHCARGIFWIAGKHVDMVTTIKEIKQSNNNVLETRAISMEEFAEIPEKITPIQQALEYAESAYGNNTLPKEEILKIDTQGLLMAKAIKNVTERIQTPLLKDEGIKTADAFMKTCSMFLEYHQSGNEKLKIKAEKLLENAIDIKKKFIEIIDQFSKP